MDIINRHKLWKAEYKNVLRLARSLGIDLEQVTFHVPECECMECRQFIIEVVVRRCNPVSGWMRSMY